MDKISTGNITFLQKLIKTCALCGIDAVAVEKDVIRGQSIESGKGIFLLEADNVPDFGFTSMGIGRVKTLGTRISILDDTSLAIAYDCKERDNGDRVVTKLQLTSKKTKVDFSCQDSLKIRAPKKMNDIYCYEFSVTEDTLKIMAKAFAAIDASNISFSSEKDGSVKFRASDVEGDNFDHLVSETYDISDDADKDNFFYEYSIKFILPLFRSAMDENKKLVVNISKRGIMKVNVNGFDIFVLPEA